MGNAVSGGKNSDNHSDGTEKRAVDAAALNAKGRLSSSHDRSNTNTGGGGASHLNVDDDDASFTRLIGAILEPLPLCCASGLPKKVPVEAN